MIRPSSATARSLTKELPPAYPVPSKYSAAALVWRRRPARRLEHSAGTNQRAADPDAAVLPGTPRWGREWKKATAKWYNHAFNIGASVA